MKNLASLAEKGSLTAFKARLKAQSHTPSELFLAVRTALLWKQVEKARLLFEAGADPLKENEEKDQLLTHAASGGDPDLVRLMISLGCDPNHRNVHQRTPLHHAAGSGHSEAINVLIDAGADPNIRSHRNMTPLFEALTNNRPYAAIQLIHRGACIDDGDLPFKETPLMRAASTHSPELVRLLLEKGAQIEARDQNGCTSLIYSARSGDLDIFKILLEAGAHIKAMDYEGRSVFEWASPFSPEIPELILALAPVSKNGASKWLLKAAGDGHIQNIKECLAQDADIQPADEGGVSALWNVTLQKSIPAFEIILRHPGANINYRCGRLLKTCLMLAAGRGDIQKIRLMLEAGADPTITDSEGKTALHHAAGHAQLEILVLFEDFGENLFAEAPGGKSLLHLAIDDPTAFAKPEARAATVQWLLSKNLDPNATDSQGKTPLMGAAYGSHAEIICILLEGGADISLTDEKGRSPLYHAVCAGTEYGYNERYGQPKSKKTDKAAPVMALLLQAGANPDMEELLTAASRYRWPGAVKWLRGQGQGIEKKGYGRTVPGPQPEV